MSVVQVIKWIVALALCYISFMVLQQHYTEGKPWRLSFGKALKHIGIGFLLVVFSPAGYVIGLIIVAFSLLTIGDFF